MDDLQRRNLAIQTLAPNCAYHAEADGTIIKWLSPNIPQPTKSEIDAEVIRLEKVYSDNEYARNRASAYDSVGDQLDMLMKDMKNNTTTHREACETVKTQFPKP